MACAPGLSRHERTSSHVSETIASTVLSLSRSRNTTNASRSGCWPSSTALSGGSCSPSAPNNADSPTPLAHLKLADATSTSSAVAQGEVLHWQNWDFYNQPAPGVGVSYVWNSSFAGVTFPRKVTTVLRIKAPRRPSYWRATTLDLFDGFILSHAVGHMKHAREFFDACVRAAGVPALANARMTRALRSVSSEKGRDPRAFAIVSHDRFFLETVATQIWELDRGELAVYDVKQGRAYTDYLEQREVRREQQRRDFESYQTERKRQKAVIAELRTIPDAVGIDSEPR